MTNIDSCIWNKLIKTIRSKNNVNIHRVQEINHFLTFTTNILLITGQDMVFNLQLSLLCFHIKIYTETK